MLASEREGNPLSGRRANPPPCTPRGFRKSLPGEFPRLGAAACRPPAVACPSPAPPTASRATGLPPQSTSRTSRTRAARTSGRGCGGARPRVGETRSGATQWKRRQDAWAGGNRETRRGAGPCALRQARDARLPPPVALRGRRPMGPDTRTRGSGSSLADSPCSRGASPPEAATRSAAGRRSRQRWPRHRPRSPCRRRCGAADGREPAGLPRPVPSRPWGRGLPPTGRGQPLGSRGRVPLGTYSGNCLEPGAAPEATGCGSGRKSSPLRICPTKFNQKRSESPQEAIS